MIIFPQVFIVSYSRSIFNHFEVLLVQWWDIKLITH